MNHQDLIRQSLTDHQSLAQKLIDTHAEKIERVALEGVERFRRGRKALIFGNGGSAADAQHMAAELAGRFSRDSKRRTALSALALSTDTSLLTAVSNDFGFEWVFARQIAAHGQEGDIAIAISTSGNSQNVLRAVEEARSRQMWTIGLSGRDGGKLRQAVDECFVVDSQSTARIQEAHGLLIHLLCEIIDREISRLER